MKPIDVLVLGAGPAGLSAAARLLERGGGRVRVRVVHLQDVLGGKAASWRDADGLVVEHGWHMMVGFYSNLFALMRRAGVDPRRAMVSMEGQSHCYEPSDGRVHTMSSEGGRLAVAARFAVYDGLPLEDRANFGRFMSEAFAIAGSGERLTRHDDVCFDTWAVEHGLRRHVTRYSIFRFLRLAYFNFPEQISAYHVLQTMKHMSTSEEAELFACRGAYTELVWNPIGAYLKRLGAVIEPRVAVTDWVYDGDRIVGLRAGDALPTGPLAPPPPPDGQGMQRMPVAPGTERVIAGFDYVLSTLPLPVVTAMNRGDERMWQSPFFRRLTNIRSAVTMSLTVVARRPVPRRFPGPLHGFPSPFNFVVDMKPYWAEQALDPGVGSVLVFGGQERGFESWTDAEIQEFTFENFAAVYGSIPELGIIKTEMHRNRQPWERLFLSEPGVEPFRPDARTPFRNLFLAGDWVRNEVGVIAMEGAVTSGMETADLLLRRAGLS
ncbi:MAG TPA: FAD-dependent oxidoreductase [Polyangiaceae bacterium]